ncbi:Co/Zn/Cd efflux system component, CzcD [Acidianus hospitalis W1]|uniref:Co/Zn/Cd efflux system component, CzcD n=1 Tax=Acidianus hospitalis (strain W1) TaxID=933801 RepID=F4B9U9_ACIHW|nr:cation diffusion facilitator family transporter [Acidianus hospitalis]AEE95165.1 Co/Zn/Cd efflux system component, CzcD [Acidianus hospitalis W1]
MRSIIGFWGVFVFLVITSILAKSAVLISEAIHVFLDALIVSLSFYFLKLVNKVNSYYTYGLHRLEVISSLLNVSIIILGSIIGVIISVIYLMMGIKDNPFYVLFASLISALILSFSHEHEEKENRVKESINVHIISDVLSYVLGALAGFLIILTGYYELDPIFSFIILGVMIIYNFRYFSTYLDIIMEKSPIDTKRIEDDLKSVFPKVHHIHVWTICDHYKVATLHIEEDPNVTLKELDYKREVAEKILSEKYGINHVTVQFEAKRTD